VLRVLDGLWLRAEKLGVIACFLVMSAAVFADVVHRLFADAAWQTPGRLFVVAVIALGVAIAAVRSASRALADGSRPGGRALLRWTRTLLLAAAGTAALAGIVYGFVWLRPSGVIWSQTLALVLMLWVAFLGAGVATHEHKHPKVDAAEHLFHGDAKRWVAAASHAVAAVGTGALCVLALGFCRYQYAIWDETGGAGGDFEGMPIPKFLAFSVLPLELGVMALRFFGNAIAAARGAAREDEGGLAR
jgi:TRAP-type C4-dicarboxylate transport system permease small subunit